MDSFPSQPLGRHRMQQSTKRSNAQISGAAPFANPEPEFYGVYTGEYRAPVRDRVQLLRGGKSIPEKLLCRPDTPSPSKRLLMTPRMPPSSPKCPGAPLRKRASGKPTASGLLTPPQTPRMPPSSPKCPGAPLRKSYVARWLGRRQSETADEDILLDRKAVEETDPFRHRRRQYVCVTPANTPLRQSWGPLELAQIDSKLQALLDTGGEGNAEVEKVF
ncbi:hypothetical protein F4803DRAFT_516586 [Xylaria telfairii]|nr:hypothetical protein F4803DRAFT_516586 [Xylaria telfairii]